MKEIKSYVIGFLTCACLFLILGQTKADNDDYEMEMNVELIVQNIKFQQLNGVNVWTLVSIKKII